MRLSPNVLRSIFLLMIAPIALAIGGLQVLQASSQGITSEEIHAKEPFDIKALRKGSDKPVVLKGVFDK